MDLDRKMSDCVWSTKAQHCSTPVLTHYDTNLPMILACDARPYGVGALISHKFPDWTQKPIVFASHILSKTEVNYSQIEKEALIIFGVTKFNGYLYGCQFMLPIDHKPLIKIFGPKTGVPMEAAARLQRWALILAAYQNKIQYEWWVFPFAA